MKISYRDKTFRKSSLALIEQANEIIEEYAGEGYDLTLRQLYYQFVARDIIGNKQAEYKRLGSVINDARLAGLVDWDSIADRTRNYESLSHWNSPADIIESAAQSYAIDTRTGQADYIEVWVEKDALVGVIEQACGPLDVGYFSCRGFVSQSEMWAASQRFIEKGLCHRNYLIHLGDHDPSGIDMSRDIQDRLRMFGSNVEVERIALNMDQVNEHQPPPNPAKTTDSRYASYRRIFGDDSWELDALDPRILTSLIRESVGNHTQDSCRANRLRKQESDRKKIRELADTWESK